MDTLADALASAYDAYTPMPHIDCPHCGKLGTVSGERVIQGRDALTTYFCDNCHNEWDERDEDGGRRSPPRKRLPRTRHDQSRHI